MLSLNELQQEKEKITALTQRLEPYYQRDAKDLPENLIKEINSLKSFKQITSSGLERVRDILINLHVTNLALEKAIENPEKFQQTYGTSTQQESKQKVTPPISIDSVSQKNKLPESIPEKISNNNETQSTVKEPKITIKITGENLPQTNQAQLDAKNNVEPVKTSELNQQTPDRNQIDKNNQQATKIPPQEDLLPPPASKIEL